MDEDAVRELANAEVQGAPKKAQSSWMFYLAANRETVKAANPGIGFGPLSKLLGAQWKAIEPSAKAPYEAQAAAAKATYAVAKAAWDALPEEQKAKKSPSKKAKAAAKAAKKAKKVKDPNAPKRGKSAYLWFCAEKRAELKTAKPDMLAKDVMKELGAMWALEADKARYEAQAAADKVRYTLEMETYVPPAPSAAEVEAAAAAEAEAAAAKEEKKEKKLKVKVPKKKKTTPKKKETPQSKLALAAKGTRNIMGFFGAPKPKPKSAVKQQEAPAEAQVIDVEEEEVAMEEEEVAMEEEAGAVVPAVEKEAAVVSVEITTMDVEEAAAGEEADDDQQDLIGLKTYVTFEVKGRTRPYSGKIIAVDAQKGVHIKYDDGDDEWATLPDKHIEIVGQKRARDVAPPAKKSASTAALFSGKSKAAVPTTSSSKAAPKRRRRAVVDSDEDEDEWNELESGAAAKADVDVDAMEADDDEEDEEDEDGDETMETDEKSSKSAASSNSSSFKFFGKAAAKSSASSSSSSSSAAASASTPASASVSAAVPVDGAIVMWPAGTDVPYASVVAAFTEISKHTGRLKIVAHLSKFYRTVIDLTPSQLIDIVYLTVNKIAPQFEGVELGLGETVLIKAIASVTGSTTAQIKLAYTKEGDLGTVAKQKKSNQGMLFQPKKLTAKAVLRAYRAIAATSGMKSRQAKVDQIKELLVAAEGAESLYIIRGLQGKLRIRLALQTCLVALSQAFAHQKPKSVDSASSSSASSASSSSSSSSSAFGAAAWPLRGKKLTDRLEMSEKTLKQVFSEVPSFDSVIPALLEGGIESLRETCYLRPGVPVNPMLAKPTKGVGEVIKRFTDIEFTCELKYDGERAQIHLLPDGSVMVFSRNLENNTQKYPDILAMIPDAVKPGIDTFIIDCEAVAYDRVAGTLLPFQVLSTRKKVDVQAEDVDVAVVVQAFDMLYLNGESLLQSTFEERRTKLHASFSESKGKFEYARHWEGNTMEQIEGFLTESIEAGGEGLMVKTLRENATYEPSKRSLNWLKLKKDYIDGMGDSLDLVPIAAYFGKGKRVGTYGAYLMACYNEDDEQFQTVCKLGTGFTDENLQLFTSSMTVVPKQKKSFLVSKQFLARSPPDVWFEPNRVWEVKAADLSISPVHTAATGIVDPSKGVALRFPRFIRVRDDKNPEESTSSTQVAQFYNDQALT